MSKYIKISDWQPTGVDDLEPNALKVVKANNHQYVIAGPGAGKTELLAQRACFLLQTGMCPRPKRILAISFKKDSAKNLKNRVADRCKDEEALRFDSFTFDAFSKNLLDRFLPALPDHWRPTDDYQVFSPDYNIFDEFIEQLGRSQTNMRCQRAIISINRKLFQKIGVLGAKLPPGKIEVNDALSFATYKWWEEALNPQSQLTFPMIGRLAELLLRTKPLILKALIPIQS